MIYIILAVFYVVGFLVTGVISYAGFASGELDKDDTEMILICIGASVVWPIFMLLIAAWAIISRYGTALANVYIKRKDLNADTE